MTRFMLAAVAAVAISLGAWSTASAGKKEVSASDKPVAAKGEAKTISGTSGCATCDGLPVKGHAIKLTTASGETFVLIGSGDAYKAAHKVRKEGKTITATLAGEPVVKKTDDGKEYKEVNVSDVKVTG